MLFYLRRNVDCTKELLDYVENEDDVALETISTDLARKALKLAREVGGDLHRGKSFTRLKVSKKGILYGELKIKHEVEDLLARFFVRRFPNFIVVLESWRGCYIYGRGFGKVEFSDEELKSVVEDLEKTTNINYNFEEVDTKKLWDEFYNSQYIPSRKNLKLFSSRVPKKFKTWETENLEKNLGCKRLDEVLKE